MVDNAPPFTPGIYDDGHLDEEPLKPCQGFSERQVLQYLKARPCQAFELVWSKITTRRAGDK